MTAGTPSGHVAFLFTDLEGSTKAWEAAPDRMNEALAAHDAIMRSAITGSGGTIFSTAGDAFGAAFHTAARALEAAIAAQRRVHDHDWPEGAAPRIRIGIHVGTSFERDANYFGPSVNRAARVMGCAHGGQIVLSGDARADVGSAAGPLDGIELRDLGSHWLPDLPEPVAIFQAVVPGLREHFPPLETASPPPPRVPLYRTTFVGREQELARIGQLLDERTLTSIVALGGTGKTRLAYKAAIVYADRFPDGVFAVELADGGPDDVDERAAEAIIGDSPLASTEGSTDHVAALVGYLAERRALVILDNCEHVLTSVKRLVEAIVRAAPDVRIIATSREVLGLPGETVLPLHPLAHQADGSDVPAAVELFLERATAAKDDLALDDEEVAAVHATCHRLEGLPLAVELAAARVRTLSPKVILSRLDDSFAVLKQRGNEVPHRHRSLEAAIWWSWNLLDPSERSLLARASVFVGGFSLDALEAVGASDTDALDDLESLVDKSLVVVDGERYRLREPIRQFALARLEEMGEVEVAHDAHTAYFLAVAGSAVSELDGEAETAVIAALRLDHENVLAAIDRARTRGDLRTAFRIAGRLHVYWEETGHMRTGLRVFESIVEAGGDDPAALPAYSFIASYAPLCGDLARGEEIAERLRAGLGTGLPDRYEGQIRFHLVFTELAAGRMDNALDLWARSGEQLLESQPVLARHAFWCAGYVAAMSNRLTEAEALFARSESVLGKSPVWFGPSLDLLRGVVDALAGGRDLRPLARGLDDLERLDLRFRSLLGSSAVAFAAFGAGDDRLGERAWRMGLEIARDMGHLWAAWLLLEYAAWSSLEQGDIVAAARTWSAAEAFGEPRAFGRWTTIDRAAEPRLELARSTDPEAFSRGTMLGRTLTLHEVVGAVLEDPSTTHLISA